MNLDFFQTRIAEAASRSAPLCLRGGGSKDFYGLAPRGEILDTRAYAGIVEYEASELVATVRGGTPLAELESTLAARGQCLAFEPPHFGLGATVGGCVAAGLSGPRRQSAGALRDYILGATIIDGRGRLLRFGGKVMKNVAGYDVSRLIAGSLGTLGLIAEVSFKLSPLPPAEATLQLEVSQEEALRELNNWGGQPLPITASLWNKDRLYVRLAGAVAAVKAACKRLGGEALDAAQAQSFWTTVREQRHTFFDDQPLWRLALPSTTPPLDIAGEQLIEWGGGLRWLKSDAAPDSIQTVAARYRGHATLFRSSSKKSCFMLLDPVALRIHKELKRAFDPAGVLNPGRMYPEL